MNNIKIINNFISQEDCELIIDHIENNLGYFEFFIKRYLRFYGKDEFYKQQSGSWSELSPIDSVIRNMIKNAVSSAKDIYKDEDLDLYVMWLSKHTAGSSLAYHHDTGDEQHDIDFKYSAILYLNTIDSGAIQFPHLNFVYQPKAGDLIMFASRDKNNGHQVDQINSDRYTIPFWLGSKQNNIWDYLKVEKN